METTSSRSWNLQALQGQAVDDMEVVEEYGLDPKLAYTPAINDAALEAQRLRNIEFYRDKKGMDEPEAKTKAMMNMLNAKRTIDRVVKKMK